MTPRAQRILVVNDDSGIRDLLYALFTDEGYDSQSGSARASGATTSKSLA
jgi:DNA-binding NtrC family response regulator